MFDIKCAVAKLKRLNPFEFRAGICFNEAEWIKRQGGVLIPLNSGLVFVYVSESGMDGIRVLIPLNSGLVFVSNEQIEALFDEAS